jgi:hypothetical protein
MFGEECKQHDAVSFLTPYKADKVPAGPDWLHEVKYKKRAACHMGVEGIVSKRRDRAYGAEKLDPNNRTTSFGVSRTDISTPYTSRRVPAPG